MLYQNIMVPLRNKINKNKLKLNYDYAIIQ